MTVNSTLMKAILSMDAYNRGYGAGINLTSDVLGSVKIAKTLIDGVEVNLDSSAVFRDPVTKAPLDDDIEFYAIAYQLANGERVISYRGTDNTSILTGDPWYGWGLGGGSTSNAQGQMAIKFYQFVAGAETNWRTANISLTGHSLGGGLAGYVAALYDKNASVFDSMTFELAAKNAYNRAREYKVTYTTFAAGGPYTEVVSPETLALYRNDPNKTVLSFSINDSAFKESIYGTMSIDSIPKNDLIGIKGTYVDGEILGTMLPLRSGVAELNHFDLGNKVTGLSGTQLHSVSTLVIRQFADVGGVNETALPTDWRAAAQYFWPVMYDGQFAKDIGMFAVAGKLATDALKDTSKIENYADILRQVIAYSAIDEGMTVDSNGKLTNARPFGDTAIRAFYDDANDFGRALSLKDSNNASISSSALSHYATWIAEAFVQYAGELALLKVLDQNNPLAKQGVISYTATPDPRNTAMYGNQALEIDFSHYKWFDSLNAIPSMVARNDLVSQILKDMGNGDSTSIIAKMTQIWGGDINIGRVIFTLTNSYGATSATDSYSSEANLFVTGDQSQLIYGTHENDIFYGRGVVGSSTDFYASVGNDIYYGGAGHDNLAYLNLSQSIIVNAVTSTVNFLSTGTTKTDSFTGIETIIGTRHGDYFYASDTGPKLKGGGGLSTYDLSLRA